MSDGPVDLYPRLAVIARALHAAPNGFRPAVVSDPRPYDDGLVAEWRVGSLTTAQLFVSEADDRPGELSWSFRAWPYTGPPAKAAEFLAGAAEVAAFLAKLEAGA